MYHIRYIFSSVFDGIYNQEIIRYTTCMAFLRVRQIATKKGFNISRLQRKADITMMAARRYWYGTSDGSQFGTPLHQVDIRVLRAIAGVLKVPVRELIGE